MKLFKRECPECESKDLIYYSTYEDTLVVLSEPTSEINFVGKCLNCGHRFAIDCIPTWVINGEY